MSEYSEKKIIRPPNDKSDYSLWRLRIVAAIRYEGSKRAPTPSSRFSGDSSTIVQPSSPGELTEDFLEQSRNVILSVWGHNALRVVRDVVGFPYQMMEKFDLQYNSKSTANHI